MEIWTVVNRVSVNFCVQGFEHLFSILWGIYLGQCGISIFNLLKGCQTMFHSSYTILHFHQPCMTVPVSPHHILINTWYYVFTILSGYDAAYPCGFDLQFLMTNVLDSHNKVL